MKIITAALLQEAVDDTYPEVQIERGPGNTFMLTHKPSSVDPSFNMPKFLIPHHQFFTVIKPDFDLIQTIQNVFLKKQTASLRLPPVTMNNLMHHATPHDSLRLETTQNKNYSTELDRQRSVMMGSSV